MNAHAGEGFAMFSPSSLVLLSFLVEMRHDVFIFLQRHSQAQAGALLDSVPERLTGVAMCDLDVQ